MAPYDSDSSGGEEEDYTETNVLLGYASPDANGEEISRLGGYPDWLDIAKPPSATLAKCKVCEDLMVLMLQLNAELPDRFPTHERRLYVFTCKRKSCRRKEGNIRIIRGVRITVEEPSTAPEKEAESKATTPSKPTSQGLGEALFGVKSTTAPRTNPFAAPSTTSSNPFAPKAANTPSGSNPFAKSPPTAEKPNPSPPSAAQEAPSDLPKTFAETLSLNNPQSKAPPPPPEPWPAQSDLPTPYPIRWLADAEYETLDPITLPSAPTNPGVMDLDTNEAGSSSGGGQDKEDKEVFESNMDATFQKFADRVGQNSDQCIRYEFSGQPLLYSKGDAVGKLLHAAAGGHEKVTTSTGLPRCGNCGAGRVFEVQLTPQAIQELECEEDGVDGMDWGTVIVGVCERDCQERGVLVGEAGYVEEWVGVQWEELTMKR